MIIFFVIFSAYLIGSIPFGYLIPKIYNVDIRRRGSGNIGATNVFRTLGPLPGTLVFLLDLSKGALPVIIARQVTDIHWLIILAGLAAILGHMFPVFLKFKGGRGAATGLGILLGIAPDVFLAAVIFVSVVILLTRYVSIASMTAPLLVTVALYVLKRPLPYTLAAALASALIIVRHIPNIKRLLSGTEPKIGLK